MKKLFLIVGLVILLSGCNSSEEYQSMEYHLDDAYGCLSEYADKLQESQDAILNARSLLEDAGETGYYNPTWADYIESLESSITEAHAYLDHGLVNIPDCY